MPDPYLEEVLERLGCAGEVRARAMFGGAGLYRDGIFFGLVADDAVYFRVDDASRVEFEARGSHPFQPFPGEASMRTYWRVPDAIWNDRAALGAWTSRALEAARARDAKRARGGSVTGPAHRAPAKRASSKRASSNWAASKRTPPSSISILRMRIPGVGPAARRWLREVGVATREDLERAGSVATFCAVRANGRRASVNLLYALEGALLGLRWDQLPDVVRANLRERAGL